MATHDSLRILPEQPFNFAATAEFATRFSGRSGADHFSGGLYMRAIELRFQPLVMSLHPVGAAGVPELALEIEVKSGSIDPEVAFSAQLTASRMVSARLKLDEFERMASEDWTLVDLVQDLRGLRVPQAASMFESLVEAALAGNAARWEQVPALDELVERFGQEVTVRGMSLKAFPTDRAVRDAVNELRGSHGLLSEHAGLLAEIADASLAGALDRESFEGMADSAVASFLGGLPGLEYWMIDWALILGLGRLDILPSHDPVIRRAVGLMTGQGDPVDPDTAFEYGRRWRPWRSVAAAYIITAMRRGLDYWS